MIHRWTIEVTFEEFNAMVTEESRSYAAFVEALRSVPAALGVDGYEAEGS